MRAQKLSSATLSFWLFFLLLLAISYCHGNCIDSQVEPGISEILFVAIPLRQYYEPLLCLASELIQRTRNKGKLNSRCVRVRVAVPLAEPESELGRYIDIGAASLDHAGHDSHSNFGYIRFGNLSHFNKSSFKLNYSDPVFTGKFDTLIVAQRYQETMLKELLAFYEDRPPPSLVVVDRYTFAGFDLAHKFGTKFIVHSPTLLFDIDNPPRDIPSPFHDHATATTEVPATWSRLRNSIRRIWYRIELTRILNKISLVRSKFGLPLLDTQSDLYGTSMIISDSVHGWFEYARTTSPLIRHVGAILPPRLDQVTKKLTPDTDFRVQGRQRQTHANNKEIHNLALVQGEFSLREKRYLEEAFMSVNFEAVFVGESCLGKGALAYRLCVSEKHHEHDNNNDITILSEPGSKVIIVTSGDLPCVYSSFICGEGYPILVLSKLLEQHEVGQQVERIGAGILLNEWRKPSTRFPTPMNSSYTNSYSVVLENALHKLIANYSLFQRQARSYGFALKGAGGVVHAANLVDIVLKYGDDAFVPRSETLPWFMYYMVDIYLLCAIAMCLLVVVLRLSWEILLVLSNPNESEAMSFQAKSLPRTKKVQ